MIDDRFSNWDFVPVRPGLARVRAMALITVAALIAFKAFGAAPAPDSAPAAPSQRLTATVMAVDARTATIDLLTGVGHALRIVRIHVPRQAEIRDVRGTAPMSAVTPGGIVYVEYQRTAAGMIASTLELREARPRGGKP
jgi:hypothetical protein